MATVEEYYDNNTSWFLNLGQSKEAQNIHRLVWGPGISNNEEAINYVNKLISEQVTQLDLESADILDLGCGVGATMSYLARHSTSAATIDGLTISNRQTEIGNQLLHQSANRDKLIIYQGDFHNLNRFESKHLIYQIESFVHSDQPHKLLQQVSQTLKGGGRYCLCDDMIVSHNMSDRDARLVQDFREGWHIGNLHTADELIKMAHKEGLRLVTQMDLTPYLNTYSNRDRLIGMFTYMYDKLPIKSVYWESLRGGDALQRATKRGLIKYCFLVFEKESQHTFSNPSTPSNK